MFKTFISILLLSLLNAGILLAECNVIPLPKKYQEKENTYVPAQGLEKHVKVSRVKELKGVPAHAQNEAYELFVGRIGMKRGIGEAAARITCVSDAGERNARKTLAQLIKNAGNKGVPVCKILDWPAYPMRGFMMDCGRSYIPLADLKRIVDFCADYKINIFHWHLTENQGWRTESRVYPELNDKKNYTRDHGKFYTFKEIRELVAYCDERGVMLIPEIDMPGHSAAFERTFKCSMQSEKGTEILKKLVDEIIREGFSSKTVPYFHIGTDEVRITNPKFVPEMVAFVRERGKKVATWNPGANYKTGEIDLVQMWSGRGRPLAGTPSLDSRLHYFNHFDSFADPVAVFFSNFAETPEANDTIAGGIAAIWCDRYIVGTDAILAHNAFYPSILAFAESAWHGGRQEYFHGTGTVIPLEGEKLAMFKNFERRMLPVKKELGAKMPWVPQADMLWRITEPFPNDGKLGKAFPPEEELKSEYDFDGKKIGTKLARGAGIYLYHVWGTGKLGTVSAFFKNPQANSTVYAQTYVWSPKAQKVGLYAQTHKISASEPDLPPPQGKWDSHESKFWLNDKEIQPPKWQSSHKNRNQETPLTNENFEVREPIPVQLKQGWNKVLVKLPVGQLRQNATPQARLTKWMFTFALVSPKGDAPVEGLIWSPDKKK